MKKSLIVERRETKLVCVSRLFDAGRLETGFEMTIPKDRNDGKDRTGDSHVHK